MKKKKRFVPELLYWTALHCIGVSIFLMTFHLTYSFAEFKQSKTHPKKTLKCRFGQIRQNHEPHLLQSSLIWINILTGTQYIMLHSSVGKKSWRQSRGWHRRESLVGCDSSPVGIQTHGTSVTIFRHRSPILSVQCAGWTAATPRPHPEERLFGKRRLCSLFSSYV